MPKSEQTPAELHAQLIQTIDGLKSAYPRVPVWLRNVVYLTQFVNQEAKRPNIFLYPENINRSSEEQLKDMLAAISPTIRHGHCWENGPKVVHKIDEWLTKHDFPASSSLAKENLIIYIAAQLANPIGNMDLLPQIKKFNTKLAKSILDVSDQGLPAVDIVADLRREPFVAFYLGQNPQTK